MAASLCTVAKGEVITIRPDNPGERLRKEEHGQKE